MPAPCEPLQKSGRADFADGAHIAHTAVDDDALATEFLHPAGKHIADDPGLKGAAAVDDKDLAGLDALDGVAVWAVADAAVLFFEQVFAHREKAQGARAADHGLAGVQGLRRDADGVDVAVALVHQIGGSGGGADEAQAF